jgi:hypothetical protein
MKVLIITSLFCVSAFTGRAQVSDSLRKADSIRQWKLDSMRAVNASPLRMKSTAPGMTNMGVKGSDPKVKSQYQKDKDGNVTGGSTTLQLGNKKKKKN